MNILVKQIYSSAGIRKAFQAPFMYEYILPCLFSNVKEVQMAKKSVKTVCNVSGMDGRMGGWDISRWDEVLRTVR